jgi:hypothetical protein
MISFFPKGIFWIFEYKIFVYRDFSVPPTDIPIEELQRDEAIDCQVYSILNKNSQFFVIILIGN